MRLVEFRFPVLFLKLCFACMNADAQQQDNSEYPSLPGKEEIFSVAAGVQHGFIFAHSTAVQNTRGARPTGVELGFRWQKIDTTIWNLCKCFPDRGLLLSWYDYDTKILGKSLNASFLFEPAYKLGKRNFFLLRGAAGLSYLTDPFDSVSNPGNQSYSASVGIYLLFGVGFSYLLNDHWRLGGTINYQHISNGGLRQPNKGINWPTAGISLSYQAQRGNYITGVRSKEKFWKKHSVRKDISIFGIAKRGTDENGNSRRMPLVGGGMQVSKQAGRINSLTLGIEIYTDQSLQKRLKRDSLDVSAVRAGLLIGHEFLLGQFIFSQQVGVYIFDQTPYYDRIYHRWGIHYRISETWGVGFHLKAHRHVADFIDARVTYSWKKKVK